MHMNEGTGSKLSALNCLMFYIHNIYVQCIVYVWNPMHTVTLAKTAFTLCKLPFKSTNLNVNAQLYACTCNISEYCWVAVFRDFQGMKPEAASSARAEIKIIWCDIAGLCGVLLWSSFSSVEGVVRCHCEGKPSCVWPISDCQPLFINEK